MLKKIKSCDQNNINRDRQCDRRQERLSKEDINVINKINHLLIDDIMLEIQALKLSLKS